MHTYKVPEEVLDVVKTLKNASFEAYLVGGCTRDLILGIEPKDWDITTNAKPEEIIALFPRTFYENSFGTVGIVTRETDEELNKLKESLRVIEVTPYRIESKYTDKRHPDSVVFTNEIEKDLARRDFTINAIAIDPIENKVVDPYKGQNDIGQKVIKAVGDPKERFNEDALRILRAVRFAAQLGFTIDSKTELAIKELAETIQDVSYERIRDEFVKIMLTDIPMIGLVMANSLGILKFFLPELEQGIHVKQNQAHSYDVWGHNLRTCQHAADKEWSLDMRLAGLFHDVAKPHTRRWSEEKKDWTFYGHDVVGGRVTREIMRRLKFPNAQVEKVSLLVRWHMFFSDTEKITLSAVRRLVANVGEENIWDLMNLRICDRIGTGRPKENPYRFRLYKSMIEEALRSPISVKMLKINGVRLADVTQETPGPKFGFILHALLEEVLDDPTKNTEEYLEKQAKALIKLDIEELRKLGEQGKDKKEQEDKREVDKLRKKHNVQ